MPVFDLKCPFTGCTFKRRLNNELGIKSAKQSTNDFEIEKAFIDHFLSHHTPKQLAYLAYRGIADEYIASLIEKASSDSFKLELHEPKETKGKTVSVKVYSSKVTVDGHGRKI